MPKGDQVVNRAAFTSLLAGAMAAATFAGPAFAVLARFIIDDLSLTRAQLGWAVAAFSVVGAVASPAIGNLTDLVGGRKAVAGIFVFSGVGLLAISLAPSYWWLVAAAMLTGVGQASGNPGTNKLIAVHIQLGQRGAVTGLKQSGVQAGVFLAGFLLPAGAVAWGWRPTLAIAGVIALASLAVLTFIVPPDHPRDRSAPKKPGVRWSGSILWLMFYGFLMGAAGGAVNTYIPLYGEEGIGLSVTVAGAVAGMAGLVAFVARVWWARHSERRDSYIRSLTQMASLAVMFTGMLIAAVNWGPWLLWVGALGLGASATSWNSVGMLAVMVFSGREQSGGASGIVLLGFLAGLGVGPPIFGWSVDTTGSYTAGLWGVLVVFVCAAFLGWVWSRVSQSGSHSALSGG